MRKKNNVHIWSERINGLRGEEAIYVKVENPSFNREGRLRYNLSLIQIPPWKINLCPLANFCQSEGATSMRREVFHTQKEGDMTPLPGKYAWMTENQVGMYVILS